jgi:prophage maintenance system killer protein
VLAVRIAKDHPLPDGDKRLAWVCLNMSCELDGRELPAEVDDAWR